MEMYTFQASYQLLSPEGLNGVAYHTDCPELWLWSLFFYNNCESTQIAIQTLPINSFP